MNEQPITPAAPATVRSAGGHSMVTTRSEIATESGEAVCTAVSTIVVRGGE